MELNNAVPISIPLAVLCLLLYFTELKGVIFKATLSLLLLCICDFVTQVSARQIFLAVLTVIFNFVILSQHSALIG